MFSCGVKHAEQLLERVERCRRSDEKELAETTKQGPKGDGRILNLAGDIKASMLLEIKLKAYLKERGEKLDKGD